MAPILLVDPDGKVVSRFCRAYRLARPLAIARTRKEAESELQKFPRPCLAIIDARFLDAVAWNVPVIAWSESGPLRKPRDLEEFRIVIGMIHDYWFGAARKDNLRRGFGIG